MKDWPAPEDFWVSEGLEEFRLIAPKYADLRLFRQWLDNTLKEVENNEESYEEMLMKKYGPFNYYDNYEENYELNKEISVLKHDYRSFLTKEELKTADLSDLKEISIVFSVP
jgi:hypothetical protein